MKNLTAENVEEVLKKCFFQEGEDTSDPVYAEGILVKFGFHKGRLEEHRTEIGEMLMQLPKQFHFNGGGGWSFLNACMTEEGKQWGEHRSIEQLLSLGLATKQARYCLAREFWASLPGGMPFFSVGLEPGEVRRSKSEEEEAYLRERSEAWLREKAAVEDESLSLSVGGLAEKLEKTPADKPESKPEAE